MDAAFCERDGLVTSAPTAVVALTCTTPTTFCAACLELEGPDDASLQLLSSSSDTSESTLHYIQLEWPSSYVGPVTLTVDPHMYPPPPPLL